MKLILNEKQSNDTIVPVRSGIGMWSRMVHFLLQEFHLSLKPKDVWQDSDGHPGLPMFEFQNRAGCTILHINNSFLHGQSRHNYLDIDINLAENFGLVKNAGGNNWILGESIELEHIALTPLPAVPDPKNYSITKTIKDKNGKDVQVGVFWEVVQRNLKKEDGLPHQKNQKRTTLRLYSLCNWNILDMDEHFVKTFGPPNRTLFVFSDIIQTSIAGGTKSNILKEAMYNSVNKGRTQFEPLHLQFIPVRTGTFDTVEIGITETDGQLAHFVGGRTVVTLLFKRRSAKL